MRFHPTDGNSAYEGGGTGAAISRDGGVTWNNLRAGLDRRSGWAVASDPARPDRWYVAAARGPLRAHGEGHAGAAVVRATDDRWTIVADDLPAMPYLLACPAADAVVAVLATGEVRGTGDAGHSWETVPSTLGHLRTALVLASAEAETDS